MHKSTRNLALVSLLVLVVAALVGLQLTRAPEQPPPSPRHKLKKAGPPAQLVDTQPLDTAHQLSKLAATADEALLAAEAMRLADHEVDLAFATALRDARQHPAPATPETKELHERIHKLEAKVANDQDEIKHWTPLAADKNGRDVDIAEQKLELAQARQALHQDQLDEANQDLARTGGDSTSQIQRLLDEHEASNHAYDTPADTTPKPASLPVPSNLVAQLRAWTKLASVRSKLLEQQQQSADAASRLSTRHDDLNREVKAAENPAATSQAEATTATPSAHDHAASMAKLHSQTENQKALIDFNKRVQDHQELSQVYGEWAALVSLDIRAIQHAVIQSSLWILLILIAVILAEKTADHLYAKLNPDHRSFGAMRMVLRFIVQAIGILLILLVLLGPPNQLSTILALAGAGLTVALKDFIVAFFGWFVLMGRNGIRVGDWVEINGIGGEVVEVGLLRTVLLETGNWADSGHPTGRKVTFVNNFAIEGHYFNFSTSGKWLWDQLEVLIPSDRDPYVLSQEIKKLVTAETAPNAKAAEEEWQRATQGSKSQAFSATPAIDVRPTNFGINVIVRYITRANERHDLRARLYQAVVGVLHRGAREKEVVRSQ